MVEILKDVPQGTKLYSPLFGEVKFYRLELCIEYPVSILLSDGTITNFKKDGLFYRYSGECMLFPSKDQRDWSKFKVTPKKVEVVLRPFDRVLARWSEDNDDEGSWQVDLYGFKLDNDTYDCVGRIYNECIPYNDETAHLLGTTDPCPIDYEIKRPEKE